MKEEDGGPAPLVNGNDAAARLLRAAKASYAQGLDESAAWNRLREKTRPQGLGWLHGWEWFLGPAALTAAVGFALWQRPSVVESSPIELVAEPLPHRPVEAPAPPSPASLSVAPKASAHRRLGVPPSIPLDCTADPRKLAPKELATCLDRQAKGSGLEAERALVTLAQLRQSRLHDAAGALSALRAHRARFPQGALRGEVDFALVEVLPTVGRVEEALTESANLLKKPWGRSRSSELRLSRGQLFQKQLHDCARALAEYTQIQKEFSSIGDEAEFSAGQCQRQTGADAEARRTFTRYLTRPAPLHRKEARAALEALKAAAAAPSSQ